MNILLINHYAGSPDMGMEFRPYYFAREWVKMGHRVDIIAADYSHLRRKNPKVTEDFQTEVIDGINYHWIKTNTYEGNGAKRAITMAQFVGKLWLNAKKIVKEFEPDAVICSSTYPLDTFVGQRIRKVSKKKVKLIHEVHDMWPATLIELGGMSKYHPFVVAMQIGENSAYKNSDFVVALLPYTKDYMMSHGLDGCKWECIPNGIVLKEWEEFEEIPEHHKTILQNLKNEGKYIIGFFGGHALSNGLDILVDVANKMMPLCEDVHFVLVGDGVEKKRLVSRAKYLNLTNITFLEPIPKKSIPDLCNYIDCNYIGGQTNPLYRFGLCVNKMFDAMASGKPSISPLGVKSYLSVHECGMDVNSDDINDIITAIYKIKSLSNDELSVISKNGKNAVSAIYNYHKLAELFINYIQR